VLVNVDATQHDGVTKENHWVLVVDENFTIHDPWYGDKANISPRYGATPAIAIMGGAYFNPQTNLNPDDMSQQDKERLAAFDALASKVKVSGMTHRNSGNASVILGWPIDSADSFNLLGLDWNKIYETPSDWPVAEPEKVQLVSDSISIKQQMQQWINDRDASILSLKDGASKMGAELQKADAIVSQLSENLKDMETAKNIEATRAAKLEAQLNDCEQGSNLVAPVTGTVGTDTPVKVVADPVRNLEDVFRLIISIIKKAL
jgi:hypothetical protein